MISCDYKKTIRMRKNVYAKCLLHLVFLTLKSVFDFVQAILSWCPKT